MSPPTNDCYRLSSAVMDSSSDTTPRAHPPIVLNENRSEASTLTPMITTVSPGTANLPLPTLDLAKLLSTVSFSSVSSPLTPLAHSVTTIAAATTTTTTEQLLSTGVSPRFPLTPSPCGNELPSLYFRESCGSSFDSTLMVSEVSVLPITPAPSRLRVNVTGGNATANFTMPSIADTTKFCNFSTMDDTLLQNMMTTPSIGATPTCSKTANKTVSAITEGALSLPLIDSSNNKEDTMETVGSDNESLLGGEKGEWSIKEDGSRSGEY